MCLIQTPAPPQRALISGRWALSPKSSPTPPPGTFLRVPHPRTPTPFTLRSIGPKSRTSLLLPIAGPLNLLPNPRRPCVLLCQFRHILSPRSRYSVRAPPPRFYDSFPSAQLLWVGLSKSLLPHANKPFRTLVACRTRSITPTLHSTKLPSECAAPLFLHAQT